MSNDLCFVLMPFGRKPDAVGNLIDFDAVYQHIIKPAIKTAGLEPIRADEEEGGGLIHTPMFERLVLCAFAVADLTTANANVFYELGVRHAVKPATTILLYGGVSRLPFDVQPLRALHYKIDASGLPEEAEKTRAAIAERLKTALAEGHQTDSPLFKLLDGYPNVQHEKTDVFRRQVDQALKRKDRLAAARHARKEDALAMMTAVEQELGPIHNADPTVLTDLMLSYRDIKAWAVMVSLVERMDKPLARTALMREQYALALNRLAGEKRAGGAMAAAEELSARAETALLALIKARGPSSETCGILGRVYKDRWRAALQVNEGALATGYLERAIKAYRQGFDADWRDTYPGINALTLMAMRGKYKKERDEMLPVVRYAALRRAGREGADYWDWATVLELAVLGNDEEAAQEALYQALPLVRAPWEAQTTAGNISDIQMAYAKQGVNVEWITQVRGELAKKASD